MDKIDSLLLRSNATVLEALVKINENAKGVCFIVSETGEMIGLMTDGDIRRLILEKKELNNPVTESMNRNFVWLPIDADVKAIYNQLNDNIKIIPILDLNRIPVDYVSHFKNRSFSVLEPYLKGNEAKYVLDCINSNWISSKGSYINEFEDVFAKYIGVKHALAVSSGTTALHLSLLAFDIGPGDEVILPDYTFAATINAVLYCGATPVLVDIKGTDWTINSDLIQSHITKKTKAIIVVHIYGSVCNLALIKSLAENNGLFLIEDCAESLGSRFDDLNSGSIGDSSTFSFFGNKTITTGEGGMVLFNDSKAYEKAAVLRDHGMSKTRRYWHEVLGYNYRMTNLQAAIGVAQMECLSEILSKKKNVVNIYLRELESVEDISFQFNESYSFSSYWLFTILINSEKLTLEEISNKLMQNGIDTRPGFFPLHSMPIYKKYSNMEKNNYYYNSKMVSKKALSLPSYANLTESEAFFIANTLKSILDVKSLVKNIY